MFNSERPAGANGWCAVKQAHNSKYLKICHDSSLGSADQARTRYETIAFNARRLDESVLLNSEDYLRIAKPVRGNISQ